MKKQNIDRFIALFDGYKSSYGLLSELREDETGKVNGRNIMIKNQVTNELYENHLKGVTGLRLVPLKENNKLRYAAIDLDKKHAANPLRHSIEELEDKIKKLALPLIPCQSKSGDVHLYCFAKEDIDAKLFMSRINEWASLLGYGGSEKFPKQVSRLNEGDVGQALNLPYFDAEKTKRYAVNKKEKLTFEQFLDLAEISRVTEQELAKFKYENLSEDYDDAPPCLQMLVSTGVNDGSRNNALFNFAIFYKNKYPDNYEDKISDANANYFSQRLSHSEVGGIIKSVVKKDYFYKCNESPCVQLCNKSECYKRKFGISNTNGSSELAIDNLTQHISSDSVRWYLECQGERIQLTTEELWNPKTVAMKIHEKTRKMMKIFKQEKWFDVIGNLSKSAIVIEDPTDASKSGQFEEMFTSWLNSHYPFQTDKKAILTAGMFEDKEKKRIYFRSPELFNYLKTKRFNHVEHEVWHWLKENMKAESSTVRVGESVTKCWHVPSVKFHDVNSELESMM